MGSSFISDASWCCRGWVSRSLANPRESGDGRTSFVKEEPSPNFRLPPQEITAPSPSLSLKEQEEKIFERVILKRTCSLGE
ncbi:hypothetical protein NPIL_577711 [Nephila pilipes]|uniref:Uncharacterized protein n=1 Tax=Nephila pilipes TaxID=299642 RepID=A0A8X6UU33_NEPPI|nr:hypothetical protein NPIL_577711 [Nephila pilipes]